MSFKNFTLLGVFCLSKILIAAEADKVSVGVSPATSTAGVFIAYEKGYFKDEKLNVDLQVFAASSAPMMPLLAKGELDVGGGNITAGLFNASDANVEVKIVADKGSVRKEADYLQLLVRSDLVQSGRYKEFKDLKGMKVSFTALGGTSQEAAFARFLKAGGLTTKDVEFVKLSYGDANKNLESKAIDATIQLEPFLSQAIKAGYAKSVAGVYSVHPEQQSAALFYSPQFSDKRRDVALRFMKAYVKGCRDYNAAFTGQPKEEDYKSVVKILAKWTNVKDEAIYKTMIPSGLDLNGNLNMKTLEEDVQYFISQGYLKKQPNWSALVDNSFVKEAVAHLDSSKNGKTASGKKSKRRN